MNDNYYKRLSRVEAMANADKAELMETLKDAYSRACAEQDEDAAADLVRRIRNKLLEETDNRMTFDRLGLSVPSGSTFTAWLSFLRSFGDILVGTWAIYRKALRDLPEQQGFPFNVIFPTPPDNTEAKI